MGVRNHINRKRGIIERKIIGRKIIETYIAFLSLAAPSSASLRFPVGVNS
jgi:hypothetical protein